MGNSGSFSESAARGEVSRLWKIINDRQERGNEMLARAEKAEAEVERLREELALERELVTLHAGGAARAEKEVIDLKAEVERLRIRAFMASHSTPGSHSSACITWGDDGQGGLRNGGRVPAWACSCGAWHAWLTRERDEARAEAERRGRALDMYEREAQGMRARAEKAEAEVARLPHRPHPERGIRMTDDTLHGKPWEDLDTHPPGDWAETRAREWLEETLGPVVVQHAYHQFSDAEVSSLAALLREVAAKAQTDWGWRVQRNTLEAVREEVEEIKVSIPGPRHDKSGNQVCDEILARLEKLS